MNVAHRIVAAALTLVALGEDIVDADDRIEAGWCPDVRRTRAQQGAWCEGLAIQAARLRRYGAIS